MVTSRDVARAAGVSQATVSRVLNGSSAVSGATRERVLGAIEALGYHRNEAAATMKTSRTHAVGVIVEELTNPFYVEVLEALSEVFSARGQRMTIWDSSHQAEQAVQAIRAGSVDGVVMAAWREDSAAMRAALEGRAPVVMLNRRPAGDGFDSVTSENRAGGALVADYLAVHGIRRPVFVAGREGTSTADERREGFLARTAALGLPAPVLLDGEFSYERTETQVRRHVRREGPPQAVFCANDLMALAALNALAESGVDVPGETWVIGFDDVRLASWPLIGLTTVSQHSQEMAQAGATLLMDRIEGRLGPWEHRVFAARLVPRRSTAGAPVPVAPQPSPAR
ncbi:MULTISPECIES: LacI family DNA-binding transcriptional regulator [Brevibacterium]|uniref:LacI family DNA-binding transcriptional regulator n=1 Tax=Brevibacterium salitolerans TaxID=1403566 RepID=A0ABN2WDE9_9MICO|nr:LacI family DNA-binding transcriptional regulator [Brevibacterium sp.]